MARFQYKDGCLLCNQCGQLYDTTPPAEESGKFECPCGNAEDLSAIAELIEFYNRPDNQTAAARTAQQQGEKRQ